MKKHLRFFLSTLIGLILIILLLIVVITIIYGFGHLRQYLEIKYNNGFVFNFIDLLDERTPVNPKTLFSDGLATFCQFLLLCILLTPFISNSYHLGDIVLRNFGCNLSTDDKE